MWSMVSVPLYMKLGPATIAYILAECEVGVVIAYDETYVRTILDCVPMSATNIRVIVVIRDVRHSDIHRVASDLNIKIVRFTDVEKWGAARAQDTCPPVPDTTAVICYSPMMATDDRPKGVVLTHQNIISAASACCQQLAGSQVNEQKFIIIMI